jgi:pimeloyl-ACP methyl ester carboxylesterase
VIRLPSGADLRRTGPDAAVIGVVCVNGGQGGEAEGTWSASLEWLVGRLAPCFPQLVFGEVRYRIKSWNRLDWCVQDAREAMDAIGADRLVLVGFSMGGAVAIRAAGDPRVEAVLGLAPWIPDRLDVGTLRGKRLDVLHGSLDRWLPGIPGVAPAGSRRGFERARAAGARGEYTIIPGALHGIALRAHRGRALPLPRARTWARLAARGLTGYAAA